MSDAVAVARPKSLLRDLVALTKPRIISLLLVTTIAPMFVAGRPSWTLVLAVFVGGYLMAGGANAVNMYMDRDIDDRMARTRLRPIPSGRMQPREVLAFGMLLVDDRDVAARARRERAHGGARARRLLLLRLRLHALAQAQHAAEHRDRRRGRRVSAARRLGRGDGPRRSARDLSLPHHLLLDAAALLGARAAQAEGLRPRRRADGAARVGRARDEAADALVHADSACRSRSCPYAFGALGVDLPRRRAVVLGAHVPRRGRARDARDGVEQAGVAALQVLAALSRAALRRDGRRSRILA